MDWSLPWVVLITQHKGFKFTQRRNSTFSPQECPIKSIWLALQAGPVGCESRSYHTIEVWQVHVLQLVGMSSQAVVTSQAEYIPSSVGQFYCTVMVLCQNDSWQTSPTQTCTNGKWMVLVSLYKITNLKANHNTQCIHMPSWFNNFMIFSAITLRIIPITFTREQKAYAPQFGHFYIVNLTWQKCLQYEFQRLKYMICTLIVDR